MDNARKDTVVSLRKGGLKNESGTMEVRRGADQPLTHAREPDGREVRLGHAYCRRARQTLATHRKAVDKARRHARLAITCAISTNKTEPCIEPLPQDVRFSGDAWQLPPFSMIYQGFLLQQQWWHNAVTGVPVIRADPTRSGQ